MFLASSTCCTSCTPYGRRIAILPSSTTGTGRGHLSAYTGLRCLVSSFAAIAFAFIHGCTVQCNRSRLCSPTPLASVAWEKAHLWGVGCAERAHLSIFPRY